jgi:hypothetical protein
MSRVLLRRDADALKYALEKLISVAEQCDSCETFPSKALDEAYAAIDAYLDKPLPEPVSYQFQDDGKWHDFINEEHYKNTVKDGRWPIRALYAEPLARKELTIDEIIVAWNEKSDQYNQWESLDADEMVNFVLSVVNANAKRT